MVNEIGLTGDTTTRTDEVKAVVTLRSGRELKTAVPELVKPAPVVAEPLQEEESQEEECLTGIILGEQVQLQPQEELKMESVEAPEELQDALESSVAFWPWRKEEEITAQLTEEGSKTKAVGVPKKNVIQPNLIDLDTTATAQDTKYPLPVAPSVDQVYILPSPAPQPTPAENPKPATPAPKAKSNPLSAMQKFKILVANV